MAALLNANPPFSTTLIPRYTSSTPSRSRLSPTLGCLRSPSRNPKWDALQRELKSRGRVSCLFSNNRKQDQARKALESALGGKKSELEKWNKEIEKREKMGGGGSSGRGGWFGGGGWFSWFNDEHFWEDAQQAILTIIGISLLYLLIAKGGVMFAVVSNSLLFALRGTRSWFSYLSLRLPGNISRSMPATEPALNKVPGSQVSAKDSVVSKWGTD